LNSGINEKVEVLKEPQEAKIDGQTDSKEGFASSRILGITDLDSADIINDRAKSNQTQKPPIPPTIKHITDNKYKGILAFETFLKYKPIEQKHYWKEYQKFE
jgi:hypothetical protein